MENFDKRLENIALGLSVPVERLKLIVDQIKVKDRMNGDDLCKLTETGIPFINTFAELTFENPQIVNDMVKEGKINFFHLKMVIKYLTNKGGMFHNLKEKQSQTWAAQYERLLKKAIDAPFNPVIMISESGAIDLKHVEIPLLFKRVLVMYLNQYFHYRKIKHKLWDIISIQIVSQSEITIVLRNIGLLIGKNGSRIKDLELFLSERFKRDVKVNASKHLEWFENDVKPIS
ncbi:Uncharacterised protein [Chryseobacterium nakagawai]|uniref:K Homology domain-containing protein n=1 Tax=Chryseobacterium nakagawai TaxID=1241982 RepID=A0AAD0YNP8_CHRNA|nr:hypothetical protein [Chryseobacterium nakagawai]AZA91163.1 hypothetical protein EG343_11235 [Chryseobacterium nakagawai]VEH22725.1 Uncharacterised protein [Chryseobacterium nakagawai]